MVGVYMEEALIEYEKILKRMFNADNWLKSKGIEAWEDIKGSKAYVEYYRLLEMAEKLQKDLHKYYKLTTF